MVNHSNIVAATINNTELLPKDGYVSRLPDLHEVSNTSDFIPLTKEDLHSIAQGNPHKTTTVDENGKTVISNISLAGKDIRGIKISHLQFSNILLSKTKIDRDQLEAFLPLAQAGHISLQGVDLSGLDLSGKMLNRKDLGIVKLVRLSLEGLDLRQANFKNANMQHIDLDKANLQGANFEGANLKKALLRGCNLENADMADVNLAEVQLQESNLRGADLRNANIKDANLTDISL